MPGEDTYYGEEGYTVIGRERYTAGTGHGPLSTLLFFAAGVLTGLGAALLLAPESGEETRERVSGFARHARQKALSYYSAVEDKAGVVIHRSKKFAHQNKPLLMAAFEAGMEAYERERRKKTL